MSNKAKAIGAVGAALAAAVAGEAAVAGKLGVVIRAGKEINQTTHKIAPTISARFARYKRAMKISAHLEQAAPKILDRLDTNAGMLTQAEIEKVIREELTKTAEKSVSQPNSGITFEALTGKLTIDSYVLFLA